MAGKAKQHPERSGIPSRAELDRGQRALAIVEKQLDLAERSKQLLRADSVKETWGRFMRQLNTELCRLPQRAAGQIAVDLRLESNRIGVIEAALSGYVAELRGRLVDRSSHPDDQDDFEGM